MFEQVAQGVGGEGGCVGYFFRTIILRRDIDLTYVHASDVPGILGYGGDHMDTGPARCEQEIATAHGHRTGRNLGSQTRG